MSWNPNQGQPGQDPNQPSQYGGYGNYSPPPQQPTDPYSQPGAQGQPGGYGNPQQGPQNPYGAGQQQYYQPPVGGGAAAGQYGPSSMSMQPNVAAGLSYIAIIGIIFFFTEKVNRFVRFHAAQSILLLIVAVGWQIVSSILTTAIYGGFYYFGGFALLSCLFSLISLGIFVVWLITMIQAFMGKEFKLPIIGDIAQRWANQGIPGMPGV